jgi:hypothetical protein
MADAHSNTENWRAIPGYEGRYEASDLGRVRSLRIKHRYTDEPRDVPFVLRLRADRKTGYLRVCLGEYNKHSVARLVLSAFVGPCPPGMQVAHQDGSRTNNAISNLRWMTCGDNNLQKRQHGTAAAGERNKMHKLTTAAVREIRQRARTETPTELARRFGVSPSAVSLVIKRQTWTHL